MEKLQFILFFFFFNRTSDAGRQSDGSNFSCVVVVGYREFIRLGGISVCTSDRVAEANTD